MCKIEYSIEELINHPKLSDDYKFNILNEMIDEELFIDWFEEQQLGITLDELGLKLDDLNNFYDIDDTDYQLIEQKLKTKENFRVIRLYKNYGDLLVKVVVIHIQFLIGEGVQTANISGLNTIMMRRR